MSTRSGIAGSYGRLSSTVAAPICISTNSVFGQENLEAFLPTFLCSFVLFENGHSDSCDTSLWF